MEILRLNGRSPLSTLADRYLMKATKKSTETTLRASIRPSINTLVGFMGWLTIEQIDYERAEGYETFLYRDFSNNTVRHKLLIASGVFSYGIKLGILAKNPFDEIEPPAYDFTGRNLDNATVHDLITLLPVRFQNICWMALYTGMRRNELVYLDWREVKDAHIFIGPERTKAGKGRLIPIGPDALELLGPRKPSGRVYDFNEDQLNHALTTAWRELGQGRIRFHDFRHTAATRFFELSRDTEAGMEIFGWKSERSIRPYRHITEARIAPMRQISYQRPS